MKFRTEIALNKRKEDLITYDSKLFLIGSCFVEHIGSKLNYYQFQSVHNPVGIFFHPLAIKRFLERAVKQIPFTQTDLFVMDGIWKSFEVHSQMNTLEAEALLQNLNQALEKTHRDLRNASHVVITLGTAWVYEHQGSKQMVANCHKVPNSEFQKHILSVESIVEALKDIQELLEQVNPLAKIIFTVSPVRHIKDGMVENSRSKAHLLAAVHEVVDEKMTFYFPSYEMMVDDLRDYRFYSEDLIHPNTMAIDYIWNQFYNIWFSEATSSVMKRVDKVQKGLQHRPLVGATDTHLKFLEQLHQEKEALLKAFPYMNFQ